jgi:hypothetical protein
MDFAPVWGRLWKAASARPLLTQLLVLALLDLAIHWTLLTQLNGYLAWGNYNTPYTASQLPSGPALFWSPFQYNGNPVGLPFSVLSNFIEAQGPLTLLALVAGATAAAKVYAFFSTLFLGVAAIFLARTLIRRPVAQLAMAVFLLAGPVQLVLYGQGDYQAFVAEALVFFSLYALWWAVHHPSQRWLWLPVAVWLMVFSFQAVQAFLLGLLLIACLLPIYVRGWRSRPGGVPAIPNPPAPPAALSGWAAWNLRARATVRRSMGRGGYLRDLGSLLARLPALIAVAAIIFVPSYVTFYVLGTGATAYSSSLAVPLATFSAYSRSPEALLVLNGYFNLGPTMVRAGVGGALTLAIWTGVVIALLVVLWLGYLFVRDRRLLYLLGFTVGAALIGSGPTGPLSAVATFLYLQFPGYAALNTSYYWGWFIIGPLDALMLGLLLQGLLRPVPPSAAPPEVPSAAPGVRPRLRRAWWTVETLPQRPRWPTVTKGVTIVLVVLLAATVLVPLANGAYYTSPDGIHEANYPSAYAQIPAMLSRLIGGSYAGVALFNPDLSWFTPNSTQAVPNAFFLYPTVRTPGLPYYLAPDLQSNAYFFWLYDQFYSNTTRYAAQLFALAGVEYFLVFYGTQSASFYPNFLPFSEGKNASVLLRYQTEVTPVVTERTFAIYRNLAFNGVALADANLSLVAGPGYDELNALAYTGIDLDNQSWLYPGDLPADNCAAELARVDRVYTASLNALIGVALACDHVSEANPVAETFASGNPHQEWVPSTTVFGVPVLESWTATLAATDGGSTPLTVPLVAGGCAGNCRIWLPIRCAAAGGTLTFSWEGASWTVPTLTGIAGVNNTMVWVALPFPVTGSGTLSITARGGWNAVGSIYVFAGGNASPYSTPVDWLNRTFARTPIIQASLAAGFNLTPVNGRQGLLNYFSFPATEAVNSLPANQGIQAIDAGGASKTFHFPMVEPLGPGSVALLLRATETGYVNVTLGSGTPTELLGFDVGGNLTNLNPWQVVRIPWNQTQSDLGAGVTLTVLSGSLWLSEVWFEPQSILGGSPPIPGTHPTLGTASIALAPGTVLTGSSEGVGPSGFVSVTFNGTFGPALSFGEDLLTATLPVTVAPGYALALSANTTPGLWVSANGVAVGASAPGDFTTFGPLFQNSALRTSDNLTLSVAAYWPFLDSGTPFTVTAELAYVVLPTVWNITDLAAGPPLSVSASTSGYQVTADGVPLVLLRVADYPGLLTNAGASLASALGTLDTLLWNPSNATTITVTPTSIEAFYIGAAVSVLATAVWLGAELWARRWRARTSRTVPPPP